MHGDFKPQNIFHNESSKYRAELIDFGNSAQYPDDTTNIKHVGSAAWAAPEY